MDTCFVMGALEELLTDLNRESDSSSFKPSRFYGSSSAPVNDHNSTVNTSLDISLNTSMNDSFFRGYV